MIYSLFFLSLWLRGKVSQVKCALDKEVCSGQKVPTDEVTVMISKSKKKKKYMPGVLLHLSQPRRRIHSIPM